MLTPRRHALAALIALLLIAAAGTSGARAEIIEIVPGVTPPPVSLPEAERQRMRALMDRPNIAVISELGPDNGTLVVAIVGKTEPPSVALRFLDVNTGALRPFPDLGLQLSDLPFLEAVRPMVWQSADVLRYVDPGEDQFTIVTLNLSSGASARTAVELPGALVSVAPDLAHVVVRVPDAPVEPGEPLFVEESRLTLVSLADLASVPLGRLPAFWTVQSSHWSADATRVALAVTPDLSEVEARSPHSPSLASEWVRDALGLIPPEQSPFLHGNEVRLYDVTRPEPLRLTLRAADGNGDLFAAVALSPDGRRLVTRMARPARLAGRPYPTYANPDLSYYRVFDAEGEALATIDAPELAAPTFRLTMRFLGHDRLVLTAPLGTDIAAFVSDLSAASPRRLPIPDGAVRPDSLRASGDGRTLFFAFSSVLQPLELFRMSVDGGLPPERITEINAAAAAANRVRVDQVRFGVSTGERAGFLVQPADAPFPPRDAPIVFWQEGGPGFSIPNQFAAEVERPFNLLPNFGIAVLVVPLAGREGLGPDVYRLLAEGRNFGRVDMQEAKEIANQLVERGWARRDQLGISGCSYGGFFASQTPALYPDTFAAANAPCALHDVLTGWHIGWAPAISYLTGATPLDDLQRFLEASPLYNADRIRTPMLLFHGTVDFLPIDITRTFHDVLARNGVEVTLLTFEGSRTG